MSDSAAGPKIFARCREAAAGNDGIRQWRVVTPAVFSWNSEINDRDKTIIPSEHLFVVKKPRDERMRLLGKNVGHDATRNVGQAKIAARIAICEALVIDSK